MLGLSHPSKIISGFFFLFYFSFVLALFSQWHHLTQLTVDYIAFLHPPPSGFLAGTSNYNLFKWVCFSFRQEIILFLYFLIVQTTYVALIFFFLRHFCAFIPYLIFFQNNLLRLITRHLIWSKSVATNLNQWDNFFRQFFSCLSTT